MAAAVVFLVLVQFGAEPTNITVNTVWPRYDNYWAQNQTEIYQTTPELNITEGFIRLDKPTNSMVFPLTPEEKVMATYIDGLVSIHIKGSPTVNLYYGPGVLIEWDQNTNNKAYQRNVSLEEIPLKQICTRDCYCEEFQHCKYY